MIEIILLGIVVIGIIILVYQNVKKSETKLNNEEEIKKLATINSGIDDLKNRTQNIENLFSGGPRAIGVVGETHMFALIQEILSEAQYIKNQKINNDTVECAIKIKETLCPCDSYFGTKELDKINKVLPGDKVKQSRLISAKIKIKNKDIEIINIYVPNGNPVDTEKYIYKLNWIDLLIKEINKKIKNNIQIILAGDFNIIPDEKDVYAPEKYINDALFRLEIRKKYRTLINLGLKDVFRSFNEFSRSFVDSFSSRFCILDPRGIQVYKQMKINNEIFTIT